MLVSKSLKWESLRVVMDLSDVSQVFKGIMIDAADSATVPIDQLRFIAKNQFDISKIVTVNDLAKLGIPLFDYVLFIHLQKNNRAVKWEYDSSVSIYLPSEYGIALFYAWFMIMTRNKILSDEGEQIPKFIKSKMGSLNTNQINEILTRNDITRMDHHWAFTYDISHIPMDLSNRLKKGIAGHRLLNIFSNYYWKDGLTQREESLCIALKAKALEGPFINLHPLGMTTETINLSFNRNLNNFILSVFDESELERMLKNKAIFRKLVVDPTAVSYKFWNQEDFDFLRDTLFKIKTKTSK